MKMPVLENLDRVILRNKEKCNVLITTENFGMPDEFSQNCLVSWNIDNNFNVKDIKMIDLSNYNENLKHCNNSDYDIVSILSFYNELVWERVEDRGKLQTFIKENNLTEESAITMLEWHLK